MRAHRCWRGDPRHLNRELLLLQRIWRVRQGGCRLTERHRLDGTDGKWLASLRSQNLGLGHLRVNHLLRLLCLENRLKLLLYQLLLMLLLE